MQHKAISLKKLCNYNMILHAVWTVTDEVGLCGAYLKTDSTYDAMQA